MKELHRGWDLVCIFCEEKIKDGDMVWRYPLVGGFSDSLHSQGSYHPYSHLECHYYKIFGSVEYQQGKGMKSIWSTHSRRDALEACEYFYGIGRYTGRKKKPEKS